MSKQVSKTLQLVKDIAETVAQHPSWWDKVDGELMPDLYQIDLALHNLIILQARTERAIAELDNLRPAATERARLEYQAGR